MKSNRARPVSQSAKSQPKKRKKQHAVAVKQANSQWSSNQHQSGIFATHLVPQKHYCIHVPSNLYHINSQQCQSSDAIMLNRKRRMVHPRYLRAEEQENHWYLQPKNLERADTLVPGSGGIRLHRRHLLHLVGLPPRSNLLWRKREKFPVVRGRMARRNGYRRPSKITRRLTTGTPSPSMSKPRLQRNASQKTKK